MDVHDKLDQITVLIEDARAMPMSTSALINRAEALGLLDELRDLLPEQLHHADLLLSDREAVVEQGRSQAQDLVSNARAEHERLVDQTQVLTEARERAASVQQAAEAQAQRLRTEADEYVDRKLAEFEEALSKLTQQVQRGRERLVERRTPQEAPSADEVVELDQGAALGGRVDVR